MNSTMQSPSKQPAQGRNTTFAGPPAWLLSVVLLLSGTGCIMFPIPSLKHPVVNGQRIKEDQLAFAQPGITDRSEFTEQFGEPWWWYPELGVSVYYWETLRGYWVGVLHGGLVAKGGRDEITRIDVLFIQFDREDRFVRFEVMRHPKKPTTKELATQWSADYLRGHPREPGDSANEGSAPTPLPETDPADPSR